MEILSCSPNMKAEYCCTIVRIGKCFPIAGADRIQRTLVNGMDMVISKDIKPGDIMFYAANETALHPDFLSANNLYSINEYALNLDADKIGKLIAEGKQDEAKALCGFFGKQNRVKLIKLKGTYSFGFLFNKQALVNFNPCVNGIDLEKNVGMDFDTVGEKLFIQAYIPKTNLKHHSSGPVSQKVGFDRCIEGKFQFHYDSLQLQRNIQKIQPTDNVTISVKMHGTSAIFARTECKIPNKLPLYKKCWNSIANILHVSETHKYPTYHVGQDNLYASRTVLRNRYIPKKVKPNPEPNVWEYFNNIIGKYLPDNFTLYGEIIGYIPNTSKLIQKDYDYKCHIGDCMLMPYRIHSIEADGTEKEWNVSEIKDWTENLKAMHTSLTYRLYSIPILYNGTLKDLYPEIEINDEWHNNVLAAMKVDAQHFGMELNEPLCNNSVPREGICIRIEDDLMLENFKLKCSKFLNKESKNVDAGVVDIEMQENNY